MRILEELEPKRVMYYFEKIASIPHGSRNTKAISDYCVSVAKENGLKYVQDEHNNVVIYCPASKGYENSKPIILQGHLDMVCEKDADRNIDFLKDPLKLTVKDGYITAEGTTLGGDDGIAVAFCLALTEDKSIPHPPLEILFTSDEEIGMLGAETMDATLLSADTLLNIDSEKEGIFTVGCAGGMVAIPHFPFKTDKKCKNAVKITVSGLTGGHSGNEIQKQRANANNLLGRVLYKLSKTNEFELISLNGGFKDNAITVASEALITGKADDFSQAVADLENILKNEYSTTDPDLLLTCEDVNGDYSIINKEDGKKIITALLSFPNGVQKMSPYIEGLVRTSLNLGILETKEDEVIFSLLLRSNVNSEKEALYEEIEAITASLGGYTEKDGEYPAWEMKKDSPLANILADVYKEQTGCEPEINAIHAGVECGIFQNKTDNHLDCVSIGPNINDIHTPREALDIESTQRTWKLLLETLKRLK